MHRGTRGVMVKFVPSDTKVASSTPGRALYFFTHAMAIFYRRWSNCDNSFCLTYQEEDDAVWPLNGYVQVCLLTFYDVKRVNIGLFLARSR